MLKVTRNVFACVALVLAAQLLPAQSIAEEIHLDLYAGAAPGTVAGAFPEQVRTEDSGGQVYNNVSKPSLTAYLPAPGKANGTAVLYLPGGGLRALYVGKEANAIIERLQTLGVAVFVLKYRTLQLAPDTIKPPTGPARPPEYPRIVIHNANANPAPNDTALKQALQWATDDCQTALHIVRSRAPEWHINPA